MTNKDARRIVKCTMPREGRHFCGDCEKYDECNARLKGELEPWESFPEVGGCKEYKERKD